MVTTLWLFKTDSACLGEIQTATFGDDLPRGTYLLRRNLGGGGRGWGSGWNEITHELSNAEAGNTPEGGIAIWFSVYLTISIRKSLKIFE